MRQRRKGSRDSSGKRRILLCPARFEERTCTKRSRLCAQSSNGEPNYHGVTALSRLEAPSAHCRQKSQACSPAFHRDLRDEIVDVAIDRGKGADFATLAIPNHAVAGAKVALDVESVPITCMPNVIDRDVVVLAPEERHAVIAIADAQHSAGNRL